MKLWRRQILWMVGILALAAGSALISNALRPVPLPLVEDWNETLGRRNETLLPDGIPVIDLARMTDLYQQKNVVVLDARSKVFYELEHIPGARSLPVEEPGRVPAFLSGLPDHVRLITYCDSVTCHMARDLARLIKDSGRPDVAVFLGGMDAWTGAGRPVTTEEGG